MRHCKALSTKPATTLRQNLIPKLTPTPILPFTHTSVNPEITLIVITNCKPTHDSPRTAPHTIRNTARTRRIFAADWSVGGERRWSSEFCPIFWRGLKRETAAAERRSRRPTRRQAPPTKPKGFNPLHGELSSVSKESRKASYRLSLLSKL